ncbi:MAG: hypothetical protein OEM23_07330, partial [Gemmatimonadota bacterium]|nr:hypothetical protein [Gemmatimonadota bacterium]
EPGGPAARIRDGEGGERGTTEASIPASEVVLRRRIQELARRWAQCDRTGPGSWVTDLARRVKARIVFIDLIVRSSGSVI